ncbi:AaceriABL124Wp [[Ashbya] aceris (nom. inval.)]|nr:AaceriABL124Wp [[Ashbya] aceris (nom. inval.)]
MPIFQRSDKNLELPISQKSRYQPRLKGRFNLKRNFKLKHVAVFVWVMICGALVVRHMVGSEKRVVREVVAEASEEAEVDFGEPQVLEEAEYYNHEFAAADPGRLAKYDEGFEHYFLTRDGQISRNDPEYEAQMQELLSATVEKYDLSEFQGTSDGAANREHVLICIPLRDAQPVLPMMFKHLMNLTYPHELIDLAFLVSDCSENDKTMESVMEYATYLQKGTLNNVLAYEDAKMKQLKAKSGNGDGDLYLKYMDQEYLQLVRDAFSPPFHANYEKPFRSVQVFKKDFGQNIGQGFSDRHHVQVQGSRRRLMGRARNWLTANALKPYHSWVYWRDADVELCPGSVIEDLMSIDYDVIVPNVWRPLPEFLGGKQGYDLNSWIESTDALNLAKKLDEDDVIVEGYAEYATWRFHLITARNAKGNPKEVIDLDGVGGVSILAKAKLFRQGVHFPAFAFENHAETEAFGKMAKKMGYKVGGLPHYTLWHIYEPSDDDLMDIARRERENRRT